MVKKVQLISIIYLLAWMICPPLNYGTIFRLLAVVFCVVWLLVEYFSKNKKLTLASKDKLDRYGKYYLAAAIVYILGTLLIQLIFANKGLVDILYGSLQTYILLLVGFIGTIYIAEKRWGELRIIFSSIILFSVVFSITTIFRSERYYEITRSAGGTTDGGQLALIKEASAAGVGTFGFFCLTSVLTPLLIYAAKKIATTKWKKFGYTLSSIICAIGVISAGYTIALLICFVGVFAVLFITAKNNVNRFIFLLVALLILLLGSQLLDQVYGLLLKIFENTMYEVKIRDIFKFLLEGESEGTFQTRQERYVFSFIAMFKYPIFGSYALNQTASVGGHSSLMDNIVLYGWLIGFCWLYLIGVYHLQATKEMNIDTGIRLVFVVLVALTALFNQLVMTFGAFFFIVPCLRTAKE